MTSISEDMAKNVPHEIAAVRAGKLTLRMVTDAVMENEKLRSRVSFHDIQKLFESLQNNMATIPYHYWVWMGKPRDLADKVRDNPREA